MKRCTQGEYEKVTETIRKSALQDFTDWVEAHADKMATANGQGDTRAIYKSVRILAGKQGKPARNLVTNGQGTPLQNAKEVAARWYLFLSNKFAVTEKGKGRTQTRRTSDHSGPRLLNARGNPHRHSQTETWWQSYWTR